MASVQANGITIEYEEQGAGEPLLLVMGLSAQLSDWPHEFVDMLANEGFRVIRHDNRDARLSTEFTSEPPTTGQLARSIVARRPMHAEYLISDMVDDAVGLLDVLEIDSAHVVGVSMGGMIVQSMAIDHPSRVRSMTSIMSNTGSRRAGRPKVSLIRKLAKRQEPTRENAVELSLETWRLISGPAYDEQEMREMVEASIERSFRPAGMGRQIAAVMSSPDRTAALGGVTAPTLVVHGMVDPLVLPSGGIATAKAVPESRLLMFNDMAHDLPRRRWQEMADAIALNASRSNMG